MKVQSRKSQSLIWIAVALAAILAVVAIEASYQARWEQRIRATRGYVHLMRFAIRVDFKNTGRYPHSFEEFRQLADLDELYVDLNSGKQSNVPVHPELNDKGGYCYDPNTGQIKMNLTRPVKEYLPWYRGKWRDEVPSSW